MGDAAPAITVENLTKVFRLYGGSWPRLVEAATLGRKKCHNEHWALKGISFEVDSGQTLGIVGSNGAGKSTLLKILTGTTQPTSGSFRMTGKVSSLLELGAGFGMDFNGRDNIFMNASILGLTRKETRAIYQKIVDFSELGHFIEHPLRTYSSGMIVRLGFSIAINVDPDILILDEVFAVGDAHFQKKCIDRLDEIREAEKTILFVSHAIAQVREICSKVLWIRDGNQEMLGEPVKVTQEYENYERERTAKMRAQWDKAVFDHLGHKEGPKLREISLHSGGADDSVDRIKLGDPLEVRVRYEAFDADTELNLVVCVLRNDNLLISVCSTKHEKIAVPREPGVHHATLSIPSQPLLAAAYAISVYIFDESGLMIFDQDLNAARFNVDPIDWDLGIVRMDTDWSFRT